MSFTYKPRPESGLDCFIRAKYNVGRVAFEVSNERHPRSPPCGREREIFVDNLLVRVHLIIEMSRPALRDGSLKSLFQVALYLSF